MHQFKCKKYAGGLLPVDTSKYDLWNKLMNHYERSGEIVTVTLEVKSKVVNSNQESLYKAFILKAADHFGTDFGDMQRTLMSFWPEQPSGILHYMERKPVSRWTTPELNLFIDKASAHLAQFGFHF